MIQSFPSSNDHEEEEKSVINHISGMDYQINHSAFRFSLYCMVIWIQGFCNGFVGEGGDLFSQKRPSKIVI